jgi:hypothetical protein
MSPEEESSSRSKLEGRICVLEELFVRLAQTGATESILGNGLGGITDSLEKIAEQLAPLRALGFDEPKLTAEQERRMKNLFAALVSPDPNSKPALPAIPYADRDQMRSAS